MVKLVISGADVRGEGGVPRAGCPVKGWRVEQGGARQPVEVQARMELARTANPFCTECNQVLAAIDHVAVAHESGFSVVTHVLGATRGHEPQDLVAGLIGIVNHFAMMIANDAPLVGSLEGAILDEIGWRGAGRFDDTKVIEQHFARVKEAHHEFVPLPVRPDRAWGGDAAIGIGAPGRAAPLIAGRPGFGDGVVGARVAQFEAGTARVGCLRPAAIIEVVEGIGGIIGGILEDDALTTMGELIRVRPDDGDAGKFRQQYGRVFGYHQVSTRWYDGVRREPEINALIQPPSG